LITSLRELGKTGIRITPIGLGCWQFSKGRGYAIGYWKALGKDRTEEVVKAALDEGINWFDTAEGYGSGRSEMELASALRTNGVTPGDVVIATKWTPIMRNASSIKKTIGKRIACLNPYPIDLHQIHFPFPGHTPESAMAAMADLLKQGKIRAVGVSNYNAKLMKRSYSKLKEHGYKLASNQVKYSLLNRNIETSGTLDMAKQLGITIIAYSPLEMGLLSGRFHKDPSLIKKLPFRRRGHIGDRFDNSHKLVETLERIGNKYNATSAQVALNWLVNFHGDIVVAIPGASSERQARENAKALEFTLNSSEMAEIDQTSSRFKST